MTMNQTANQLGYSIGSKNIFYIFHNMRLQNCLYNNKTSIEDNGMGIWKDELQK